MLIHFFRWISNDILDPRTVDCFLEHAINGSLHIIDIRTTLIIFFKFFALPFAVILFYQNNIAQNYKSMSVIIEISTNVYYNSKYALIGRCSLIYCIGTKTLALNTH